jgi:hypothetical protein
MPNTLTRNPSESSIESAKKIHGTKPVIDALNELERLRMMAKMMIRASDGNCSTYQLNEVSNQYSRILNKYFGD